MDNGKEFAEDCGEVRTKMKKENTMSKIYLKLW
jgi:hypothetical protein